MKDSLGDLPPKIFQLRLNSGSGNLLDSKYLKQKGHTYTKQGLTKNKIHRTYPSDIQKSRASKGKVTEYQKGKRLRNTKKENGTQKSHAL